MEAIKILFEIMISVIAIIIALLIVFLIIYAIGSVRLDFASGSHRITPTSMDTDIWGNYKVYYKTSEYTKDTEESFYYIDKNNTELADEMREYIKQGETVMVYYERYVGFKGFTAPETSPIIDIEVLEEMN